jgi:hypothetical protein
MRATPLTNQAVIAPLIALIGSRFVAVATFFVKNVRERDKNTVKPTEHSVFHIGKIKSTNGESTQRRMSACVNLL